MLAVLLAGCATLDGEAGLFTTVKSASMEPNLHEGDRVRLEPVASYADVRGRVELGPPVFGLPGDIVAYRNGGSPEFPLIVHRVVAYAEPFSNGTLSGYRVRWGDAPCDGDGAKVSGPSHDWCVWGTSGIRLPSYGVGERVAYRPVRPGFITKGDNPTTNPASDQDAGLSRDAAGTPSPVLLEWIEGRVVGRA